MKTFKELLEAKAELKRQKDAKMSALDAVRAAKDVAKVQAALEELKGLNVMIDSVDAEIAEAERAAEENDDQFGAALTSVLGKPIAEARDKEKAKFIKALRTGKIKDLMSETGGTDGDAGGVTVPQDIQTRINTYVRENSSLYEDCNIQTVSAPSGSRVLEKLQDMTELVEIDELDEVPEEQEPKFTTVKYSVKKRAGHIPITRDLLKDSDANIEDYIVEWFGKKYLFTFNKQVLKVMDTCDEKTITTTNDKSILASLKKLLNVELDPAISSISKIYTNQNGFNILDNLTDSDGRPLLESDPQNPTQKMLKGRPIRVLSSKLLPDINKGTAEAPAMKAPLYVGNLFELLAVFNLKNLEIAMSEHAKFLEDKIVIRGIERSDYVKWDGDSMVKAYLEIK